MIASLSLEQQVAQAVAAMSKRTLEDSEPAERPVKMPRVSPSNNFRHSARELQPAPFFYYRDFSREPDPDPLTPLTTPGRVPNFPAKMMAILSRADLADVVAWLPHGRSWRVLKPREFEARVIPTYL
jgi:hypothetical protein